MKKILSSLIVTMTIGYIHADGQIECVDDKSSISESEKQFKNLHPQTIRSAEPKTMIN